MPGFKARGEGKSPTDLTSTLNQSNTKDDDKALYQTIFGLITILATLQKATDAGFGAVDSQISELNVTKEEGIPAFFFMGSS